MAATDPGDKGPPVEVPASSASSTPMVVELEEDWDEAVEQWDHDLHLEEGLESRPEPMASLPFPYGGGEQFDEEADPLPPLPDAPALPDFHGSSSVPPTLIRELQSAPRLDLDALDPAVEIADAELPVLPAAQPGTGSGGGPPPSEDWVRRLRGGQPRSAAPLPPVDDADLGLEVSAVPLPPPPSDAPAVVGGGAAEEPELEVSAPLSEPLLEDDGADEVILSAAPSLPPRKPADLVEDFYDDIEIESPAAAPAESAVTPVVRADAEAPARAETVDDLFEGLSESRPTGGDFDRDRTPSPGESTFPGERIGEPAATILIEADLPPGTDLLGEPSGDLRAPAASAEASAEVPAVEVGAQVEEIRAPVAEIGAPVAEIGAPVAAAPAEAALGMADTLVITPAGPGPAVSAPAEAALGMADTLVIAPAPAAEVAPVAAQTPAVPATLAVTPSQISAQSLRVLLGERSEPAFQVPGSELSEPALRLLIERSEPALRIPIERSGPLPIPPGERSGPLPIPPSRRTPATAASAASVRSRPAPSAASQLSPASAAAAQIAATLQPRRLPLPTLWPLPSALPASALSGTRPLALDLDARRQLLRLCDAEADAGPAADPARRNALLLAAAQQAEALQDRAGAAARYRRVLADDPRCRPALRGLRRVLAADESSRAEAIDLLSRELDVAAPGERAGLLLQRAELELRLQRHTTARQTFAEVRDAGPALVGWSGIHDAALLSEEGEVRAEACTALAGEVAVDAGLRAALELERAHLEETAGHDSEAAARYLAVLQGGSAGAPAGASASAPAGASAGTPAAPAGAILPAGLGLFRVTQRLAHAGAGGAARFAMDSLHLLAQSLPAPVVQAALYRRQGLRSSTPPTDDAARVAALGEAVARGDTLALSDLAEVHRLAGRHAEAAQADRRLFAALPETVSVWLRATALLRAGEDHRRAGELDLAREALEQALELTGPDALARRALARVLREAALPAVDTWRREAREQPARAAHAHLQIARALVAPPSSQTPAPPSSQTPAPAAPAAPPQDAARRDEAIAELRLALAARPGYAPALELLRDLLVQAGRPEEAARALLSALTINPEAASESALGPFVREDAARLLGRAGQHAEAARLLLHLCDQHRAGLLQGAHTQAALRWQLLSLLGPRVELTPEAEPELAHTLSDLLCAEAEGTTDRQRAAELWYRRGVLLMPLHPLLSPTESPAEESLRRALTLEPAHGGALSALCERVLSARTAQIESAQALSKSPALKLLIEQYRERLMAATGRPEAVMLLLRLSALLEHEAQDPGGALQSLNLLRSIAPGYPGAAGQEQVLISLARRAGDQVSMGELLERELHDEKDDDQRFALLLRIGELYELQRQPRLAAGRYEEALELRPFHPVALEALFRAYERAGMYREVRRLIDKELAEVQDVPGRVAAYERLVALCGLDPDLKHNPQASIEAYESILNVDANHHMAMRVVERHYIAAQDFGSLIHLYEQMGLTATDTAFAVQIHLDRARLRQRLAWQSEARHEAQSELVNELENDFRLALYRDRHSRPALRHVLTTALRAHDLNQVAELSTLLAEVCDQSGSGRGEAGDGRAGAVFLTRAAECQVALGRDEGAVSAAYRLALQRNPQHVPAIRGLLGQALLNQRWSEVADAAELLAAALHQDAERYDAFMLAGAVAQEHLLDLNRAIAAYRAAQQVQPRRLSAFTRLRHLFLGQGQLGLGAAAREVPADSMALASLFEEQLRLETDPRRLVPLHVELAVLLRDVLRNRERAKLELREALRHEPVHGEALAALGDLYYEDREWPEAVEVLLRRARIERRPSELAEIFLRLGQIYSEQLPDARRAVASYARALELVPEHQAALSQLSALYLVQQRPDAALPLLRRLAGLVTDKEQKVAYLHRVARLHEGLGELREALSALRQAVDVDPMYLPAIGELAHFFDRQSDVQSMRVHLDRAASWYRQMLRAHPDDVLAYQALQQILTWRRSTDLAALCAEVLHLLGGPLTADGQALLQRLMGHDGYPGPALREQRFGLDDLLYPASIPPGFRNLFAMLHEPLSKLYRTDARKLDLMGVVRRERLPRSGHPVRDLANRIAADLGVGEFDIYLTAAQGKDDSGRLQPYCTVEATEVPALVLSQPLLLSASERELRFFLGGLLKLVADHLILPLRLSPDSLGTLVGGVVRIYEPNYVAIGIADRLIVAESQRLQRAIPRKLQPQLLPVAMECASTALDFATTEATLIQCQYQMGLLMAGSVTSAYQALRRLGPAGEAHVGELLRFAVSAEFAEMRALLGTNLG